MWPNFQGPHTNRHTSTPPPRRFAPSIMWPIPLYFPSKYHRIRPPTYRHIDISPQILKFQSEGKMLTVLSIWIWYYHHSDYPRDIPIVLISPPNEILQCDCRQSHLLMSIMFRERDTLLCKPQSSKFSRNPSHSVSVLVHTWVSRNGYFKTRSAKI